MHLIAKLMIYLNTCCLYIGHSQKQAHFDSFITKWRRPIPTVSLPLYIGIIWQIVKTKINPIVRGIQL